jgi:hypothetical protein
MTKGCAKAQPVAGDAPAPRAVEDLGLGDRYRYLVGASGRRYLFTRVSFESLEDYRGAVVVLERPAPRRKRGLAQPELEIVCGETAGDAEDAVAAVGEDDPDVAPAGPVVPVWFGEVDRDGRRRGAPLPRTGRRPFVALVHLLAGDAASRRDVLDDLEGGIGQND